MGNCVVCLWALVISVLFAQFSRASPLSDDFTGIVHHSLLKNGVQISENIPINTTDAAAGKSPGWFALFCAMRGSGFLALPSLLLFNHVHDRSLHG